MDETKKKLWRARLAEALNQLPTDRDFDEFLRRFPNGPTEEEFLEYMCDKTGYRPAGLQRGGGLSEVIDELGKADDQKNGEEGPSPAEIE